MVAIYKYENGLKFTGKIAKDEKTAWELLDKIYGFEYKGIKLGCNHEAFKIEKIEEVL